MCPHPNDFHNAPFFEDLINQAMMNADATRIRSGQITNELLVSRRSLERIEFKDFEQFLGLCFQSSGGKFHCIFLCLLREDKCPFHQVSSGEHFSTGVLSPRTIDSRILGIERRYNVS